MAAGYRGRGCQRGRAACRSAAAPGDAGIGDHPAAGRRLLPARGDRDRPEIGPVSRRHRGADPRRGDRTGPGRPGRHRQDPAGRGLHRGATERPGRRRPGLDHRERPARHPRRVCVVAGAGRQWRPGRGRARRRGPVHRLARAHRAALGAGPRRPGRPGRPGTGCGRPGRTARSSSPPGCLRGLRRRRARGGRRGRRYRPGGRVQPPAGAALPQLPGSPTTPTSGSRRSTSPRTWRGCRSGWPRRRR